MRTSRTLMLVAALTWVGAPAASAQEVDAPELLPIPRADTVFLYLPDPPQGYYGMHVYRAAPGGALERLTERPVRPAGGPAEMASILGPDLERLSVVFRAADEVELYRRLRYRPALGYIATMAYRSAARALGRLYVDPGVTAGETYRYRVVLVDDAGEETDAAREAAVEVSGTEPPAPEAPEVDAVGRSVRVAWDYRPYTGNADDLVVGFHVYRAAGGAEGEGAFRRVSPRPVLRNDAAPMVYLDESVEPGRTYRYRLRSVDVVDRESAPSAAATVRAGGLPTLAPPQNVAARPGEGRVTVLWPIAPEPRAAGYRVERSGGLDQPFEPLHEELIPVQGPRFVDRTVAGGRMYAYRVVVVDTAGRESPPSNPVVVRPFDRTPPEAPDSVVADDSARTALLSWTPSASSDAVGYHVYQGERDGKLFRVTAEPVTVTRYRYAGSGDAGLQPGGTYAFTVTAVDRLGNESPGTRVTVTIPDDQPPEPPAELSLSGHHGRHVVARWLGSPSRDVDRYVLLRGSDGDTVTVGSRGDGERFVLRDTAVVRGTEYEYRLIAVDTAGNRSEPAVRTHAFRDWVPPPAPRHAAAASTDGGVTVRWERVVDPELAGYRVYRSTLPTGRFEAVSGLVEPGDELEIVDPGGEPRHFYVVRAVDRSGNESENSPVVRPR